MYEVYARGMSFPGNSRIIKPQASLQVPGGIAKIEIITIGHHFECVTIDAHITFYYYYGYRKERVAPKDRAYTLV